MRRPDEPTPTDHPPAPSASTPSKLSNRAWRVLGATSFAIGIANAFIPLLPTTIFLLIGVWAYGKGDPVMRQRLLDHPRFGPGLRRWVEHRQISRRGKWAACIGIAASAAITAALVGMKPVTWMVDAGLVVLMIYLATRKEPPPVDAADRVRER
ncbi:MAG TPA: YbaN family protein [Candidatus Aquabacterium excrementipullorum]|nr:YbaN family protein [Candidatus Aquabacterium excrementipullorum]